MIHTKHFFKKYVLALATFCLAFQSGQGLAFAQEAAASALSGPGFLQAYLPTLAILLLILAALLFVLRHRASGRAKMSAAEKDRLMLQAVSESILLLDKQGCILSVNSALLRSFGLDSRNEAVGKKFTELLASFQKEESEIPACAGELRLALEQGRESLSPVCTFWRKDGSEFSASVKSTPIYQQGELSGSVLTFREVVGDTLPQLTLRNEFFANSAAAIILNDDFVPEDANNAALTLFGVHGLNGLRLLVREELLPEAQTGAQPNLELLHEMQKEATRQGSASRNMSLHDREGRVLSLQVTLRTATLYGRTMLLVFLQEAGEESEKVEAPKTPLLGAACHVQDLLGEAPLGVIVANEGLVSWNNHHAGELVKLQPGSKCAECFVNREEAEIFEEILERQGLVNDFAVQMIAPDGKPRSVYLSALSLELEGKPSSLIWVLDISELKRLEKAVIEAHYAAELANRTKNDFLARMSHEIRTPMNAILGMGYLCLQTKLNNKQRDYLNKIQEAAQMLLGVINDILDFSKAGNEGMALEKSSFHMDAFLESFNGTLMQRARKKGLDYSVSVDPRMPNRVIGDSMRISQILQVLIGNGLKFTEQGGVSLSITVESEENNVISTRFTVSDTGIGMGPEEQANLFQPFSQADASSTRRFGGAGLGLAISKNLVELMGGNIWVESEPGQGSTFHFIIPLIREMRGPAELSSASQSYDNMEVLVVDDNITSVLAISSQAESLGFKVSSASSGLEALDMMEKIAAEGRRFNVLLLDWRMDELDGIETAHLVQSAFPPDEVPLIILVSASENDIDQSLLDENGIQARLAKPVTAAMLDEAISSLLGIRDRAGQGTAPDLGAVPAADNEAPPSERAPDSIEGARLLLVEDNEINQEIALALLEEEGMNVDVANNGQEAVDKVRMSQEGYYQLVFMDIQMPIMDGLQAASAIRALGRDMDSLPIVAMTAHARESDRQESLAAGMNAHITKPLDPVLLHETLLTWIDPAKISPDSHAPARPVKDVEELLENVYYTPSGRSIHLENGALPVFSQEAGLESVGGNHALYAKLLLKFYDSCRNSDQELSAAIQANDNELAVRTAHTVKGVSASLGMIALSQVAGAAEKALKDSHGGDAFDKALLDMFGAELSHALEAVNAFLGEKGISTEPRNQAPQPAANATSVSEAVAAEAFELLNRLLRDLERDWLAVMDAHDRLNALLKDTALASDLYNLTAAVENFDIPLVQSAVEKLEGALSNGARL